MKKEILALLVVVACWGPTLQANDWKNAPISEVQKAAEQGDVDAQFNLGVMYDKGRGVAQDDKQAVAWYRKAAEQGNVDAQYNLGVKYEYGKGVAQDYKQAVAWYRKAAEQGDVDAQRILGMMYDNGVGVVQDNKLAYVWSSVSAANGDVEAATNRDLFAKRLSPAVLAEAQALAGQYVELYQPKQ